MSIKNNIIIILLCFILVSCASYKSKELAHISNQITSEICVLSDNPDYQSHKDSFYYMEYGDIGHQFGIDFLIEYTSVKNREGVPKDMYKYKFEKYEDLYKQQTKLLNEKRYLDTICEVRIIPVNGLLTSDVNFKKQIERRDSLELKRTGGINEQQRGLYIYRQWKNKLNHNKEEKNELTAIFPVEQFLVRYDGKKAIRITSSGKRGAVLYVYIKKGDKWIKESEQVLPYITIF